ncbi:hypothetical protein [Paracoccus sp. AK26]|uniref:hypothetical protein n=1 Tax=Paracoccus sp. AK26 TaxID=2589076 RepID=UPI001AEDDE4B|nr:hypothetical protein [Paracoccus sp. AK26]
MARRQESQGCKGHKRRAHPVLVGLFRQQLPYPGRRFPQDGAKNVGGITPKAGIAMLGIPPTEALGAAGLTICARFSGSHLIRRVCNAKRFAPAAP